MELKRWLHRRVNEHRRGRKAPRMLYGYLDGSGTWRSKTRISDTAAIYRADNVTIGDNVYIGHYTILDGTGGIEIGEGTQISSWAGIFTHSSHVAIRLYGRHYTEVPEDRKEGYRVAPVRTGRYVFIGLGAIILSGVTIGNGAMVTPGSIVRQDAPPFAIISGNPAEIIGDTRDLDRAYLDDPRLKEWYEEWQVL